jgi:processive 1,2-diacylglycerol beta-glucosyltransferase
VHLARLGIPEDRITVSGVPIDPGFADLKDVRAMREKHGLASDGTTVLVSASGLGVGPVERLVGALLQTPGGRKLSK